MDFLESLDAEVSSLVDNMPVEVIIALMKKWDREMGVAIQANRASIPTLLNHYVRLKIAWTKLRRRIDFDWTSYQNSEIKKLEWETLFKIKEARRNYYVARIRDEADQHNEQCACRGCKCIRSFTSTSQGTSP